METIQQAKASLKDGVSLVVFPEGARTFTGHMGYFKKGAFQLADDLQLAVVPVTIDGSFEILPRTGKWIHRHRMILTIHDPIPPKGKGMENIKATMAEAYTAVESALPEKYKGMVKTKTKTDNICIICGQTPALLYHDTRLYRGLHIHQLFYFRKSRIKITRISLTRNR